MEVSRGLIIDEYALLSAIKARIIEWDYTGQSGAELIEFIRDIISEMPSIDAEPVRHGRWVLLPNRTAPSKLFRCSECGNVTEHKQFSRNGYYSFCKDCGAKMDGGE